MVLILSLKDEDHAVDLSSAFSQQTPAISTP